jgi:hypothetical protein
MYIILREQNMFCFFFHLDNPDQPTVEHFQMLRRQWSSRAHYLMAALRSLKNVQYSSVEGEAVSWLDRK